MEAILTGIDENWVVLFYLACTVAVGWWAAYR